MQSNHLDIGFSDYVSKVMNRYLTGGWAQTNPGAAQPLDYDSFLAAANTSRELRDRNHLPARRGSCTTRTLGGGALSGRIRARHGFSRPWRARSPGPTAFAALEHPARGVAPRSRGERRSRPSHTPRSPKCSMRAHRAGLELGARSCGR